MKVVCTKCDTEASSKCPVLKNIFPSYESERESNFWFGMGFELKPAGAGWKEGTLRLHVTMIVIPPESEEEAMKRFIEKMQRIPEDQMDKYICKHSYRHTEDCQICSFTLELV